MSTLVPCSYEKGLPHAVEIDPTHKFYGWIFYQHPDGQWVSVGKAPAEEMQFAINCKKPVGPPNEVTPSLRTVLLGVDAYIAQAVCAVCQNKDLSFIESGEGYEFSCKCGQRWWIAQERM